MNKATRQKLQRYGWFKMAYRLIMLILVIWSLVVAYQAKSMAEWVNEKQDNIIEGLLFTDQNK